MKGDKNFTSCLQILEEQGFEAEHILLVQLFGCIEAYWNILNVENFDTQRDSANSSVRSNMENLEIKRDMYSCVRVSRRCSACMLDDTI